VVPVRVALPDEILTLKEIAKYLKLAEKTAYRLAAEGKLPSFKVGGSWRFSRKDIELWIAMQKGDRSVRKPASRVRGKKNTK
jgi:excisionase family DNA binding protein